MYLISTKQVFNTKQVYPYYDYSSIILIIMYFQQLICMHYQQIQNCKVIVFSTLDMMLNLEDNLKLWFIIRTLHIT